MKARGLISTVAASGVDVGALAKAAGTTYEMARRYSEGRAMPRHDKIERIAEWLETTSQDLLYGTQQATPARLIHTEALQSCIQAAQRAEQLSGKQLKPEAMAKLVAILYEEAMEGKQMSEDLLARILRFI